MRKINGVEIKAKAFAYDGCHKIYLLKDMKSRREASKNGYDIYTIDDLLTCFVYACPLRFINEWGGDYITVVPQASKEVVFEGFNIDDITSAEYEIVIENNVCTLKSFA